MKKNSESPNRAQPILSWSLLVKVLVSLGFILLIVLWLRDRNPIDVLRGVRWPWVAASLGVSACMIAVSCLKWQLLLKLQGHRPGYPRLLRLYLIGYFYGNLLPTNVGGDVARSLYAGRDIGSQSDAAVSVFLERFTGVIVMFLLAALGPLAMPSLYGSKWIFLPVLVVSILLIGFVVVMGVPGVLGLSHRIARRALGGVPFLGKVVEKFFGAIEVFAEKLRKALSILWKRPGLLALVMAITLLFYGLTWLNIHVSYRAFAAPGEVPPWSGIIAVTAVAMLAMMIPALPGALGLAEASYIKYFSLVGVAAELTFAMSLLLRLKLWLIGGIGWLLLLGLKRTEP